MKALHAYDCCYRLLQNVSSHGVSRLADVEHTIQFNMPNCCLFLMMYEIWESPLLGVTCLMLPML